MFASPLQRFLLNEMHALLLRQSGQRHEVLTTYLHECSHEDSLQMIQTAVDFDFSRQQLKALAYNILSLPLGLRVTFASSLQSRFPSLKSFRRVTPIRCREGVSVHEAWRAGKVDPVQILQLIHDASISGDFTSSGLILSTIPY